MKFADAKNDAERFELLWRAVTHYLVDPEDKAWFELLSSTNDEILESGYQGIPLPGDIDPDGKEITRTWLDGVIEEAAARWRAENRLEHRVRDLVADAVAARNAAALKIREDFHKRWGSYWKCGRCGGPLLPGHAAASAEPAKPCPHGDHEIILVHNGYSWTTR
jgi:rubrerythrin